MRILYTYTFAQHFKKLPRHFRNIDEELDEFLRSYEPKHTDAIGHNCYKIRFSSGNYKRGKRGGLRITIYYVVRNQVVVPLTIYSKSRMENLSQKEILFLLNEAKKEVQDRLQ